MWEFVDKVVYINLDHREDRRQIMARLFQEGQIPLEKVLRFPAIRHAVGIVGCAIGHIAILKRAKREGWKNVLILEDDLTWTPDFQTNYTKLETLTKSPYDVCMLGGLYMETTPPKIHIAFCTNAYIVNSHYYDTLLDNFEYGLKMKLDKPKPIFSVLSNQSQQSLYNQQVNKDDLHNVDVYWFKLQMRDNWVAVIDPMIEQVVSHSDIYGKIVVHQTVNPSELTLFVKIMKSLIAQGL
jgi:glycosyl transferase family 25